MRAILEEDSAETATRQLSVTTHTAPSQTEFTSVVEEDPEFVRYEEGGDFLKDPRIIKLLLEEFKKREALTKQETLHVVERNLVETLFKAERHRSHQLDRKKKTD